MTMLGDKQQHSTDPKDLHLLAGPSTLELAVQWRVCYKRSVYVLECMY